LYPDTAVIEHGHAYAFERTKPSAFDIRPNPNTDIAAQFARELLTARKIAITRKRQRLVERRG